LIASSARRIFFATHAQIRRKKIMNKKYVLSFTAAATISLMAGSASAQTQWIEDTLTEQCSAASQDLVANATRDSIEDSVARAEASIQAPASIGDLSCMNELLKANIDVFSSTWADLGSFNLDSMISSVTGGLKSGLSLQTLTSGVERAICDFAEETFGELTGGLTGSMDDILSGIEMPSFSDGFGQMNLGLSSDVTDTASVGTIGGTGTAGNGPGGTAPLSPTPTTSVTTTPTTAEQTINGIWNSLNGSPSR
jgi:hypothetical protein